MTPIFGHDETVSRFVAGHIEGCERGFGKCKAIGVVHDGQLVAGIVYHNWNPESAVIELSAAGTDRRWLSRPVIKAMFGYPFDQIGCQMVVLRVSERNGVMCGIARRFGFREYRVPRLRGRDEAEIIFTLTEEDWRAHRVNRR